MKKLAGNGLSAEVLKSLWFQLLPSQIQVILPVSSQKLQIKLLLCESIRCFSFVTIGNDYPTIVCFYSRDLENIRKGSKSKF